MANKTHKLTENGIKIRGMIIDKMVAEIGTEATAKFVEENLGEVNALMAFLDFVEKNAATIAAEVAESMSN